ncbi:Inositol polyphosphate multikinase beta-like protein, partial [Drosera capensis]
MRPFEEKPRIFYREKLPHLIPKTRTPFRRRECSVSPDVAALFLAADSSQSFIGIIVPVLVRMTRPPSSCPGIMTSFTLRSSSVNMFKATDHQVAGHQALNGKLGPLIDDSGRFFKRLQNDERGAREVEFDVDFTSNTDIPSSIKRISGLQVYDGPKSGFWKPDRKQIKKFSIDDVKLALRKFVSSAPDEQDRDPDCAFASI